MPQVAPQTGTDMGQGQPQLGDCHVAQQVQHPPPALVVRDFALPNPYGVRDTSIAGESELEEACLDHADEQGDLPPLYEASTPSDTPVIVGLSSYGVTSSTGHCT